MDIYDKPAAIRQGEEINTSRVEEYLKDTIPGLSGSLSVEQFPSGYSNLTYLIRFGDKAMVLRRPPFGTKAKTAHDMGREYRILSALRPIFPYVPEPLVYCEDEAVIGCPFYVMERINGIIIRREVPEGLEFTKEQGSALCKGLIDVLHELHTVDYVKAGLGDFGKPEGYVLRQVSGWSDRFRRARTDDAPDFEMVMQWLEEKMPAEAVRYSIIHNDYKFDNVVLSHQDPLSIIGILDWEMATIGDPLMDLGCALAYWVQPGDPDDLKAMSMIPADMPGLLTREELVEHYALKAGIALDNFDFYLIFGLFRVAVIMQQIYYRYYHGQTKDKRFGMLIFGVHIMDSLLKRAMEKSSL